MGLRLKFNLVLSLVFLLGLGVTGYESCELLHKNAREEVLRNAGVMMESALSMRGYTVAQVRPVLQADPEKFLPQSVPAYAATEIMTLLRKKYPDYSYKEAALNPTNPRNRAVEWETDIVNEFRNNGERKEFTGTRMTPNGLSLYLARPFQIKDPACLSCHTSADQAPPAMVKLYGNGNGYGWKLNEVIGAQIVSVPMTLPIQNANENQEILKQNIAHMYKYYNDLIYRQNDGTTKFDKPTLPEINSFRPRSVSPLPKENFPSNQPVQTLQLQKESMPAKVGQNTAIQLRYTTKQLVQIFKGLGRF